MLSLAATVWVMALLGTSGLFVAVVVVQAGLTSLRSVTGRDAEQLKVTVLMPAPTAVEHQVAA